MTTPKARLLVLGVDAASPELLTRWADDGLLPNLRSLMDRGLRGSSRGIEGFFIGATWPSFYTGLSPAKHGLHYLRQLEPGTYTLYRPAEREFVRGTPFWTTLSRAGRRVAVLDVPLSRLDPEINGIQTVEWGGHDRVFGFGSVPPSLEQTIQDRWGPHPAPSQCDRIERTDDGYRRFVDQLVEGVATKAELTRDLLARGEWDLFLQVFTEAHCVGHQCWHLHDPAHPAHDPHVATTLGDPLIQVYRAIDTAIGQLVATGSGATVVVVSAHGMGPWHGAQFLLREILFRLGFAAPRTEPEAEPESLVTRGARSLWRSIPRSVRQALGPIRDRVRGAEIPPPTTIDVDLSSSRCFVQPNGLAVGGIRVNLAGREPNGIVPASEREAFEAEVSTALCSLIDERTGRPAIRRIMKSRDLYRGPQLDRLPDLLVEWETQPATGTSMVAGGRGATVRIRSDRGLLIEGTNDYGRTGEHRPDGMFIAAGPGIGQGHLGRAASILDYAPTFAAALGVRVTETDGHVIEEIANRTR